MISWLERASADPSIEIDGRSLPIAIRRHTTARRLVLRLAPDGSEVRVTMPRWGRTREAEDFVRSRSNWIAAQLARLETPQLPVAGGHVPFRGEQCGIVWNPAAPRLPTINAGKITLGGSEASIAPRLERWLRAEALRLMEADLAHYCAAAGVTLPRLALSRAQRRWGSCSTSGTVRINWRLVMAPDHVRRSVVAHEVAHLVHFDHSAAFHQLLGRLYESEIGMADLWLKQHGRALYRHFG